MQELLGRIARLDPSASLGLRVIACFDELVVGNVNTRALLAAAASLSACTAGFSHDGGTGTLRVSPRGELVPGPAPDRLATHQVAEPCPGMRVWLERDGAPAPNDAIVLERLALAVRIRHGHGRRDLDERRRLAVATDGRADLGERRQAATSLGIVDSRRYRGVAAPLFAVWQGHPAGPEDVVPTHLGPLHAVVVTDPPPQFTVAPGGISVAVGVDDLHHGWRTAIVALLLCDPPRVPMVNADEYGGLVDLLADLPLDAPQPDAERVAGLTAQHSWAPATLEALLRAPTVREAARHAGVHHSTMQNRLDTVCSALGYNPFDALGRVRFGAAYLVHRMRASRVLDLPAPSRG